MAVSTSTVTIETCTPVVTQDKVNIVKGKNDNDKRKPIEEGVTYGDFRDDLLRDGFAVIKGVVSRERCEQYIEKIMTWLESFPYGFRRNDRSTWVPEHLPASLLAGIHNRYAVQHEQFMWDARLEPKAIDAFKKIWGTDELLVSFDAINITIPSATSQRWAPWPHVDQSPRREGMQCVQGVLTFTPSGPTDGGLVVLRGSHRLIEKYFQTKRNSTSDPIDYYTVSSEELKWLQDSGCELVKVCAEAGDYIVWDSRTVHYNTCPESSQDRFAVCKHTNSSSQANAYLRHVLWPSC